jgi:hypothetical protein
MNLRAKSLFAWRNVAGFLGLIVLFSLLAGLAGPVDLVTLISIVALALLFVFGFNYFVGRGRPGP